MHTGKMKQDHEGKILQLALSKALEKELRDAIAYCKATIQHGERTQPSGVSAQTLTLAKVASKLAEMRERDSGK